VCGQCPFNQLISGKRLPQLPPDLEAVARQGLASRRGVHKCLEDFDEPRSRVRLLLAKFLSTDLLMDPMPTDSLAVIPNSINFHKPFMEHSSNSANSGYSRSVIKQRTGPSSAMSNMPCSDFQDRTRATRGDLPTASLRPDGLEWASETANDQSKDVKVGELTDAEQKLIPYRQKLVDGLPSERAKWSDEDRVRELTYFLLDFHRRADKPE
jgi:hypothetical protein